MKKIISFCMTLIILAAFGMVLQKRFNVIAFFEPSTTANQTKNEEYVQTLWKAMAKREATVVIPFVGTADEVKKYAVNAIQDVFEIDKKNTSSDFDYLRYHYCGTNVTMTGFGRSFQVSYQFQYLETEKEMKQVDQNVKKVLKKLKIDGKSDYKKIRRIHDYIVRNAQYDMSAKNNSAYASLIKKSSACQGYATLTYKMMTEAGIPCRIISGTSSGELHAWNIVKLDGKWYNLDCTWDDPVGEPDPESVHYEFFLKSEKDFTDHRRDGEYDSNSFRQEYPMAVSSYGR